MRERRSLLLDDVDIVGPDGLRSALAAPLVADERVVGSLVVASLRFARFDRDDQRLLEVVGHLAGLCVAHRAALITAGPRAA